ncbi:Putative peptide ABC transporter substrate-binding protein [Kitasatospora sp. MMS16-BH015]|uniref:ABC transporter substrate-binding protein n=1 Tax=Kitasatospora sp. MMS16-BH015 TaxID=2018025 RepID=UPI000CA35B6C|nr:ABC transporter substrate-binding protein [Kitasatospora sp. MMS16-BH015]AUG79507.1 Putative peptide ABC transporter substrate-binding protein [Kitasatospora sp. MMS16-BH015]
MNARKSARLAAAVMVVGALTATAACSSSKSDGGSAKPAAPATAKVATVAVGTAADSTGPAVPQPGAKPGGTVNMIDRDDFNHLDPGQIYLNTNAEVSLLFTRGLTGYKVAADGSQKLVGDLATDTGTTTDGGKTWKFTLKDGVKWQDGSPITSDDVKYSIERTFQPFIKSGPSYLQAWLAGDDYRKAYAGPAAGDLPGVATPDAKTIVYTFKDAHADANFTFAMAGYGIVPKAHDTKEAYDKKPFSSGPYQIVEHVTDKSLDLERNPNWDPKTDPIRNAYPDKWHMEFGVQPKDATERFMADNGTDKNAFSFHDTVPAEYVSKVKGDEKLKDRTLNGLTPYVDYYFINNTRITDQKVREALIRAFPHQQTRQVQGGPSYGDYATTYMSPTVLGFEASDVFDTLKKPQGDPEAAKKILTDAGKLGQTIVYAYNDTPAQQKVTEAIRIALEAAGFKFVPKPLPAKTYYDAIGIVKNEYDLYWGGWGADWPTGYTSLQPVWDGRAIADGASNYAHLNDPEINKAIDDALKIQDPAAQGKAWAAIDQQLQKKAVSIPDVYQRSLSLYGSGLGGVSFDTQQGLQYPLNIYIKG